MRGSFPRFLLSPHLLLLGTYGIITGKSSPACYDWAVRIHDDVLPFEVENVGASPPQQQKSHLAQVECEHDDS